MPTIKVKKEMNLPELLNWAMNNKEQVSLRSFYSKSMVVRFNTSGYPHIEFDKKFLPTYEVFTVGVKEEITKYTELPKVLAIYTCNKAIIHVDISISDLRQDGLETVYLVNEDDTHTLIWRNGRLVD